MHASEGVEVGGLEGNVAAPALLKAPTRMAVVNEPKHKRMTSVAQR